MNNIKKELKITGIPSIINSIVVDYLKYKPIDMKLNRNIKEKLQFEYWDPDMEDEFPLPIYGYKFHDEGKVYPILYIEYKTYDHHNNPIILATIRNINNKWIVINKIYRLAPKYNQTEDTKRLYDKLRLRAY